MSSTEEGVCVARFVVQALFVCGKNEKGTW